MPKSDLVIEQGDCTMVRLEGNNRAETATILKESLMQARLVHAVAIEWDQAEHVDACVLQVLLAIRKLLKDRGLPLTVTKDNPKVREYLKWSGLSEYFPAQPPGDESRTVGASLG